MVRKSERTEILAFLRKHVINRTVVAEPLTTSDDQGKLATSYEDQTFFNNLVETSDGFCFDLTALARGNRYVRGERGFLVEGTLDAIRVYRYHITERKSSGKLVGYGRFVASSNTQDDPFSGTCFLARLSLQNGELFVEETQAGYSDFVSADGGFKPVASDGRYRYAVENGKLALYYQQTLWDVDAESLRRTRSKDKLPEQVSRETELPVPLPEDAVPVTPARRPK